MYADPEGRFKRQGEGIAAAPGSEAFAEFLSGGIHQTVEIAVVKWGCAQRLAHNVGRRAMSTSGIAPTASAALTPSLSWPVAARRLPPLFAGSRPPWGRGACARSH